jgi:hypothetical protein
MTAQRFLVPVLLLAGTAPGLCAAPADRDAVIDRHALAAPSKEEETVDRLARYLKGPAKNDREKVRAIFRWVTDRITYDVESFLAGKPGDNSTAAVLKSRKAVCEGYANLVYDLCRQARVPVAKVRGWAKGFGYDPAHKAKGVPHSWNAVSLNGKWHLLDATWGAGHIKDKKFQKVFNPFYFLTPPDQFIFTHFPGRSKWQLLKAPLSAKEYTALPKVSPQLFRLGVSGAAVREQVRAKNFRGLVKTFEHPGRATRLVKAPLELHLRPGTSYRFRFQSYDYEMMAAQHSGKWFYFKRNGNVFEGDVVAPREGTVTIRGKVRGAKKNIFWGILRYEVK